MTRKATVNEPRRRNTTRTKTVDTVELPPARPAAATTRRKKSPGDDTTLAVTPKPIRRPKSAPAPANDEQPTTPKRASKTVKPTATETEPTRERKTVARRDEDLSDDELVTQPHDATFGAAAARTAELRARRGPAVESDELVEASYFDLLLERPAAEDPDELDEEDDEDDDEGNADLLEGLSNPSPRTARWDPDVQLTSADYNDRNQELFARRNIILARIETLETKRRLSAADTEELRRARFTLDTTTNDIVSFNYGLVLNYTRKFTSTTSKDDSMDFEAAGVVGLMRAVKSYDPTRGTKFSTWAYKPIQREILKAVRDADFKQLNPGDFEKRPEILRAVKALQNGNDEFVPTFEAVAVEAGATLDAVKRILNAPIIESLSAPMGEDGDGSLTDMIEDPSAGVEDTALARQEILDLEQFGLSCLDERELFVIGRRFGLDGEPPQRLSAIGTLLGLSREAVRQVEAKALSKLLHPVTRRRLVRHGRR